MRVEGPRALWARARVRRARVGMEFKLNLEAHDHHLVATDARLLANARAAASSAASRVNNSSAAARARAAGAAAIANGRGKLANLRAYKLKWHTWLYKNPGQTNFWLLISNVLYIAVRSPRWS